MKKGFSVLELVVVIAILATISSVGLLSVSSFNARHAIEKDALSVLSTLNEARSRTLSSKDGAQYGVHVEEFQIVLFKGASYVSGDSENQVFTFSPNGHISNIGLSGGANNVVFAKLTGAASRSGTLTVSSTNDSSVARTITIYSTGVVQSN